jgi:WhiB family redox-sensing transcriptional regulator
MKWLPLAACTGESPDLFDQFTFPAAYEALRICSHCRFTSECMDWVRPSKSFFDGVAAGVVWRNGYRVRSDNSTREDRIIERRMGIGEHGDTTGVSEIYGQGTLPFD